MCSTDGNLVREYQTPFTATSSQDGLPYQNHFKVWYTQDVHLKVVRANERETTMRTSVALEGSSFFDEMSAWAGLSMNEVPSAMATLLFGHCLETEVFPEHSRPRVCVASFETTFPSKR